MIVPQYWAEARLRQTVRGKAVTIRRFGWSDESAEAAQAHAEGRAKEAMERAEAGESPARREAKVAYNGADGMPIREEILARHGDAVVTRNGYGAPCLNTPNALFVDIDFPGPNPLVPCLATVAMVAAAAGIIYGLAVGNYDVALIAAGVFAVLAAAFALFGQWKNGRDSSKVELAIRDRIERFLDSRREWKLRVYRTPNGYRLLAMHRTFDPRGPEAEEAFRELGSDPLYVRMCQNQNCFRARVGPKPWRMGMEDRMRPRPGVWPVKPERMAERQEWIGRYEARAKEFSSCRFVEEVGGGRSDTVVVAVQRLHDDLSGAMTAKPMA